MSAKRVTFFGKILDSLCGLNTILPSGTPHAKVPLAWVGGYPAHYMGEFHCRLQAIHPNVFFLYMSLGQQGRAFEHEITNLPEHHMQVSPKWRFLQCWRSLEHIDPEAVLIAGNFPRPNLVAAAWAWKRGRALYYLADSNLLDSRNLQRKWLNSIMLGIVLRSVTKILCIGTRNAEFYMQYLKKEELNDVLLPFPLPHLHQRFESACATQNDVFFFLVFGRLDDVKAVDKIIKAFALLDQQSKLRSRLLIAGDGPSRPVLESLVEELGLGRRVKFLGSVPSNQAPQIFGKANALVLASRDEPWGLVVNEAFSARIPVIGPFWIGAFADLVVHEKTGLITQDNSPSLLAAAMRTLMADPKKSAAMGQAGQVLVKECGWTIEGSLQAISKLPELKDNQN